jgi:endonuclease/exonuclease/phosphatase family metal-dependent hydrolase
VTGTAAGNRPVCPRLIVGAALAAVLISSSCVHRTPANFDPSQLSSLSCRNVNPSDAPSVQWSSPTDPHVSFRLSRWCATVGPVYFIANPRAADVSPIDRVAIVAWNIHEGRGRVDELIQRLRLGEFTAGEPVVHFVLLLQEAIRRGHGIPPTIPQGYPAPRRIEGPAESHDVDLRRLAENGFAVLYAPSMRNGERAVEDRGNAIVSTLPLNDATLVELPVERQRRVAIVSSVQGIDPAGKRWHLGLVDVHLDTALALLNGGPFEARRRQAVALLDMLRPLGALSGPDRTAVVAGDFNTWRGRGEPAITLLGQEYDDGADAIEAPTWTGPLGLHATLDQIFVRGAATRSPVVRLSGRFGSDHYPLLTVLEF